MNNAVKIRNRQTGNTTLVPADHWALNDPLHYEILEVPEGFVPQPSRFKPPVTGEQVRADVAQARAREDILSRVGAVNVTAEVEQVEDPKASPSGSTPTKPATKPSNKS